MLSKKHIYLVSVILPVYNRENLVMRAVKSVVSQTYNNWELICIDDGSTDHTYQVLKEAQEIFGSRIKVFRQSHSFLPAARNRGIQNSSGRFITFIDSDDEYKPWHLSTRIDFMKNNTGTDMIHGGVDVRGSEWVPDKNDKSNCVHISECAVGATFFGYDYVFRILKGFKELGYSEDSEFLARAKSRFVVTRVSFPTYIYHRESSDSITMQKSEFLGTVG